MIQRVWNGARGAKSLERVIVATDDARIADACRSFGAEVALTRSDHASGTDRIAEVAEVIECDVVVNVQGDEPLIEGFVIDALVAALAEDPDAPMATLVHTAEPDALGDPNRVKVVLDRRGRALYFSRSVIPYPRDPEAVPRCWQHVGLYAYRREFLLRFTALAPTPAERAEGLEQLRALEHGFAVRCAVIEGWTSAAVDVPADIAAVEERLRASRPAKSDDAERAQVSRSSQDREAAAQRGEPERSVGPRQDGKASEDHQEGERRRAPAKGGA